MKKRSAVILSPICVMLVACGQGPETGSNGAEDFAARINGGAPQPEAIQTPTVAAPLPNAAEGPYVPGTLTDPQSSICGANLMGEFVGKKADDTTRAAIMQAAEGNSGSVRFVLPGSATVQPDPTNPRLSIMIDNLGIIRDARCG